MSNNNNQLNKALHFHQLHHSGKMLVFPNVWDPLGAILLESLQYPAIATASAAIAFTNGYNDGENIPFSHLLALLSNIAKSVGIPVSADIESAYATHNAQLKDNIRQLILTGIVGINIEDTEKETNTLIPTKVQCNRISIIKNVSAEMGIPLFINARTDVYIQGNAFATDEAKLAETITRGKAYKNAGADCFFPIVMRQEQDIKTVVEQVQMPINILTIPGIPSLQKLNEMGVARLSLGPSLLKIALQSMKGLALKLQNYEGLSAITENEITSNYLKDLVTKNDG